MRGGDLLRQERLLSTLRTRPPRPSRCGNAAIRPDTDAQRWLLGSECRRGNCYRGMNNPPSFRMNDYWGITAALSVDSLA
jgi:hypothetical protein